jgi:hypothetical protein
MEAAELWFSLFVILLCLLLSCFFFGRATGF